MNDKMVYYSENPNKLKDSNQWKCVDCKVEFYIDPKISLTQHEEGIHLLI